ncbi:MAG: LysR family transcriptional regulator [Steroidobacteraceae bacterium]
MKTEWLESILCIARQRNIDAAARELGRAVGTVRQHLTSVEQEVGIRIFEARDAQLHPTPAGALYLRQAQRLMAVALRAAESARAIAAGNAGTLRLGICDELATPRLAALIRASQQRFPGLKVQLEELSVAALQAAVSQHRIDLALLPVVTEHRDLVIEKLWQERWRVVLPVRHPLRGNARLDCRDLRDSDLVLSHPMLSPCGHDLIRAAFAAHAVEPRTAALVLGRATMLTLVNAGVGATFVPESFSISTQDAEQFPVMVPFDATPMEIAAAYHSDGTAGVAKQFLRVVREAGASG